MSAGIAHTGAQSSTLLMFDSTKPRFTRPATMLAEAQPSSGAPPTSAPTASSVDHTGLPNRTICPVLSILPHG